LGGIGIRNNPSWTTDDLTQSLHVGILENLQFFKAVDALVINNRSSGLVAATEALHGRSHRSWISHFRCLFA
jgi:hypothetical protein